MWWQPDAGTPIDVWAVDEREHLMITTSDGGGMCGGAVSASQETSACVMRLADGLLGPRRRHARAWTLVAVVMLAIAWMAPAAAATERSELPVLEVFWAEGCFYCAAERAWLPVAGVPPSNLAGCAVRGLE